MITITQPKVQVLVSGAGVKVVTAGTQGPASISAAQVAAMQALFNRIYLGGL